MVRRWSYLVPDKLEYFKTKYSLKPILIKKGFKHSVRFRKNYVSLSKVFRKKYSLRKIKNNNFLLIVNAFNWAEFYTNSMCYEKKSQYKSVLPFNNRLKQSYINAYFGSSVNKGITLLSRSNFKNSKLISTVRLTNDSLYFTPIEVYTSLAALNWAGRVARLNYDLTLTLRKLMTLCVLIKLL